MKQSHWLLFVAKNNFLWLVQKNHATVTLELSAVTYRRMKLKTYSKSRIELWNLQILKKMLEKSSQFFVIRAAMWAEKLGRCLEYCRSWKNMLGKLAVAVNIGGHLIQVIQELWMKRALVMVEICVLWAVVGDSQISLILVLETPYLIAVIQLAVNFSKLYFVHCCALKRTGMIRIGKQGCVFILTDFK